MNRHPLSFDEEASALNAAAARLRPDPSEPPSVELVTWSLAEVEEALRALSLATGHAADTLIPRRDVGENSSRRYARAAAAWPRDGEGTPPSYERQAQILATLHDAGATIRAAAERCRRARDVLASTIA